jgi:hypothetical protein
MVSRSALESGFPQLGSLESCVMARSVWVGEGGVCVEHGRWNHGTFHICTAGAMPTAHFFGGVGFEGVRLGRPALTGPGKSPFSTTPWRSLDDSCVVCVMNLA